MSHGDWRCPFSPDTLARSPLRLRLQSRCKSTLMLTIDFADPATNADPFPIFARLRESDPVHWSEPMKAWVVTRYEDVKAIALNKAEVAANRLEPFFAAVPERRRTGYVSLMGYLSNWIVFRDPPDHTR